VHDVIVHKLGKAIVSGKYKPSAQLPAEEELVSDVQASRTSVREAIRTLSALGLVESRARVGVIVNEPEKWRVLDPPVLGWFAASINGPEFAAMVQETRRIIEPSASALAAERASSADLAFIEANLDQMKRNVSSRAEFVEADLGFHRGVLRASKNTMLIALSGTIEASLRYFFTHSIERATEAIPLHENLLERIRMRDPAGASEAAYRLLELASSDQANFATD
jgi:DNA-binding FadR family transcriptional regulator